MRTHGMSNTRLYRAWSGMKQRCLNTNDNEYRNYGGRGIVIYPQWMDFGSFAKWALLNGYDDSLTIERIDVNGNYCPENCKWATLKEQMNNKRNNVVIHTHDGDLTLAEYCYSTGIKYSTAQMRILRGRHFEKPINFIRKPVIRDDGAIYPSIAEAARDNGVNETRIRVVCRGGRKQTAKHGFSFLNREAAEAALAAKGAADGQD